MSTIDLTTGATQLVKFGDVPSAATRISILNANLLSGSGSLLYGTGNRLNTGSIGTDNNVYQYAEVKALAHPSSTGSEVNYGLTNTKDGKLSWAGIVTDFSGGDGKYLGAEVGKKIDDVLHISGAEIASAATNAIQLGSGINVISNSFQVFDVPVIVNGGIPFGSLDLSYDAMKKNEIDETTGTYVATSIVVGNKSAVDTSRSVLVGVGVEAPQKSTNIVAIGYNARSYTSSDRQGSVSIGANAIAQDGSVSIGTGAQAGKDSVTIGINAVAYNNSVAIGKIAQSINDLAGNAGGIAIGYAKSEYDSTIITPYGSGKVVRGEGPAGSVVIGCKARIINADSTDPRTQYSIAIGKGAEIDGSIKENTSDRTKASFIQIGYPEKVKVITTEGEKKLGLSMNVGPYKLLNSDGTIPNERIPELAEINKRLDDLGFKQGAATYVTTVSGATVTINSNTLQKMGKWCIFNASVTFSGRGKVSGSVTFTIPPTFWPAKPVNIGYGCTVGVDGQVTALKWSDEGNELHTETYTFTNAFWVLS